MTNPQNQKRISMCGMDCSECQAFIATNLNDDIKRQETAENWSEMFGEEFHAGDINCDGCISDSGRLITFGRVCEVRSCGLVHEVENCGHCEKYSCRKLNEFFPRIKPGSKDNLDGINLSIKNKNS